MIAFRALAAAMAAALPAAPGFTAGPGDLSGAWTYTATCPGGQRVQGRVYFECGADGSCHGVLHNDLHLQADIRIHLEGETVYSELDWGEAGLSVATGTLAADGLSWEIEDSDGCHSRAERASI